MISEQELRQAKAPFKVRYKGRKRVSTVVGFAQNDPLGVGGGLLPDIPVAHFKGGGWILVSDLIQHYRLVRS